LTDSQDIPFRYRYPTNKPSRNTIFFVGYI